MTRYRAAIPTRRRRSAHAGVRIATGAVRATGDTRRRPGAKCPRSETGAAHGLTRHARPLARPAPRPVRSSLTDGFEHRVDAGSLNWGWPIGGIRSCLGGRERDAQQGERAQDEFEAGARVTLFGLYDPLPADPGPLGQIRLAQTHRRTMRADEVADLAGGAELHGAVYNINYIMRCKI